MAANTRLRGDDGGAAQVVAGRPLRVTGIAAGGAGSRPAPDRPALHAEVTP
jgi:hypothetical protein